jgi:hypothetical protein
MDRRRPNARLTLASYDTGTIGGILAMKYWRHLFSTGYINPKDDLPDVTASQTSTIVSILSAGTFFVCSCSTRWGGNTITDRSSFRARFSLHLWQTLSVVGGR